MAYITTLNFFSDGTFTTSGVVSGMYEIKDGKLVFTITTEGLLFSFDYSFSNNNERLTITDSNGRNAIYTKQMSGND